MLFRGTAPALVTPFTADNELDESAFRALIEAQIAGGMGALVVLGTTGENPTVTHAERRQLVDWAVDAADGRVPVIVGTGTNSTAQSITFSQEAEQAGADGLLVVGPYYNKPSQDNFVTHTAAIAEAAELPIVLYNVPGRTGFNITAETTLRIAQEVPQVVGIKEASGDLQQITDILAHRPSGFAVYAGDDEMALPVTLLGGDGVVSVIGNALPEAFASLILDALAGDVASAQQQHFNLLDAMRACFYATNPVPVKTVLAATGAINEHVRLPLESLAPESAVRRRVLEAFAPHIDIL
jgi:4-hydroxy-tetrahydrodipicolinate synthase